MSDYSVSNGTTRKSGYSLNKAIYVQEFNGTTWVDKNIGTVEFGSGEFYITLTTHDQNYKAIGIVRGSIA